MSLTKTSLGRLGIRMEVAGILSVFLLAAAPIRSSWAGSEGEALSTLKSALIKAMTVEACLKKVEVQHKVVLTGPNAPKCLPPGDKKLEEALISAEGRCASPDYMQVLNACKAKFPCVKVKTTTALANPLCNQDKSYCVDSTFSETQNCSAQETCKVDVLNAVKVAYEPLTVNAVWKIRQTPCAPPTSSSGGTQTTSTNNPGNSSSGGSGVRPAPTERIYCSPRPLKIAAQGPWTESGEIGVVASSYQVDLQAHRFSCLYTVNGRQLGISRDLPSWVTSCEPMTGLATGMVGALCR